MSIIYYILKFQEYRGIIRTPNMLCPITLRQSYLVKKKSAAADTMHIHFCISFLLVFLFPAAISRIRSRTGNTMPANTPVFKFPPEALETRPTRVGPPPQPRSPASARNANIDVPPFFISLEAVLNVPGHKIPTDNPHRAQPIKPRTGNGESEIRRYEPIHKIMLNFINRARLIFSPYLP